MIYVNPSQGQLLNVILHGLAVITQDANSFSIYAPNVPGHSTAVGSFGYEQLIVPNGSLLDLTLNVPGWPLAGAYPGPDPNVDVVIPVPAGSTFDPAGQSVCRITLPRTRILHVSVAPRRGVPIFLNGAVSPEPDPIPYLVAFQYQCTGIPTLTDPNGNNYFSIKWPQLNLHVWSTQAFEAGAQHSDDELRCFNAMFKPKLALQSNAAIFTAGNPTLPAGVKPVEIMTLPGLMQGAMGVAPTEGGRAHCFAMWVV